MKAKNLTVVELVLIRNWMIEVYNLGKSFVPVDKKQLLLLLRKLEEVDSELLNKILYDEKPIANFVDENFEATLEQIRRAPVGETESVVEENKDKDE